MELEEFAKKETLTGSEIAKVLQLTIDVSSTREFCTQARSNFEILTQTLLSVVNDKNSSLKNKTAALAGLSNFARHNGVKDHMQQILKKIDDSFETTLNDKEQGNENYGTQMPKLHSAMLVFLMRVFNYDVSAEEVMEYASGKLAFSIDILICILKVPTYEIKLIHNCASAFFGMTIKTSDDTKSNYQTRVEVLLEAVLRTNIIGIFSNAVLRQLRICHDNIKSMTVSISLHNIMKSLYKAIINLYRFSIQGRMATTLRQGLLVATSLIDSVVPSLVQLSTNEILNCFDNETGKEIHPPSDVCLSSVVSSLKIAAFSSFHMGSHSFILQQNNMMTVRVLLLPVSYLKNNLEVVSALLHYNVNIDSLSGNLNLSQEELNKIPDRCRSPSLIKIVSKLLAMMTCDDCHKIIVNMTTAGNSIPLAKDTTSYEILIQLLEGSSSPSDGKIESDAPISSAAVSPNNAHLEERLLKIDKQMERLEASSGDENISPSLRLLGDLPALGPSSPVSVAPMSDVNTNFVEISSVPQLPVSSTLLQPTSDPPAPPQLTSNASANIPPEFTCAINNHLMKQVVRAPSGHVFEKGI